jgi:hypothetical protein
MNEEETNGWIRISGCCFDPHFLISYFLDAVGCENGGIPEPYSSTLRTILTPLVCGVWCASTAKSGRTKKVFQI